MPYYVPVQLLVQQSVSWYLLHSLKIALGDTANLVAVECMDVAS